MNLGIKEIIDLYELIDTHRGTREENRAFALKHKELLSTPLKLLGLWRESKLHLLPHPHSSTTMMKLISGVTLFLLLLSFALGLFSGIGLLHYSGDEPVNLIYFLAMVCLLPLVTMILSIMAMLRANQSHSMLVHISPAYWMEQIILLLPRHHQEQINMLKINPLLANWIVLKRSQLLALSFSLGLFLALIGVVVSRDIAFAWSTTLDISPESFHYIISLLALPWSEFLPQAVPSLELIEKSQYFRLGGKLDSNLVSNAALLGLWWKFLAMATLFYALILRFGLYLFASFSLRRAIERSIFSMDGIRELLHQMQEPLVTTQAQEQEPSMQISKEKSIETIKQLDSNYTTVIGWAIDESMLEILIAQEPITANNSYLAGGLNSLKEDQNIIDKVKGNILLYVKSWEPPTMDFIDFLEDLSQRTRGEITLYPIGTVDDEYRSREKKFTIWEKKISELNDEKIRMKR